MGRGVASPRHLCSDDRARSCASRRRAPRRRLQPRRPRGCARLDSARRHEGKFLWAGDEKLYVRGVTYGTFARETATAISTRHPTSSQPISRAWPRTA